MSEDPSASLVAAPADASAPRPQRDEDEMEPGWPGLVDFVRLHPWITAIMLICTVGGGVAGPWLLEETWSLARQIGAGAFLGAWIGLTITVTKMIG